MISTDEVPFRGNVIQTLVDNKWVEPKTNPPRNPSRIIVDRLGKPWIVDTIGDIHFFTGTRWIIVG